MAAKLNGNGYLEPGLHPMTTAEFETEFVTSFPHSSTRKAIYSGYVQHLEELLKLLNSCEEYIDGSFVSNKNDPGDIDLVIFADAAAVDALPPDKQKQLAALASGPTTKATHRCDAYFCPVYPDGHPFAGEARAKRKYWLGEFGFDRTDKPKGIVHVVAVAPHTLSNQPPASATLQPGQP